MTRPCQPPLTSMSEPCWQRRVEIFYGVNARIWAIPVSSSHITVVWGALSSLPTRNRPESAQFEHLRRYVVQIKAHGPRPTHVNPCYPRICITPYGMCTRSATHRIPVAKVGRTAVLQPQLASKMLQSSVANCPNFEAPAKSSCSPRSSQVKGNIPTRIPRSNIASRIIRAKSTTQCSISSELCFSGNKLGYCDPAHHEATRGQQFPLIQ